MKNNVIDGVSGMTVLRVDAHSSAGSHSCMLLLFVCLVVSVLLYECALSAPCSKTKKALRNKEASET